MGTCTHQFKKAFQNPLTCFPSRYSGYLALVATYRQHFPMAFMGNRSLDKGFTGPLPAGNCIQIRKLSKAKIMDQQQNTSGRMMTCDLTHTFLVIFFLLSELLMMVSLPQKTNSLFLCIPKYLTLKTIR
ncbi:hypothetical protein LXM24_06495 [Dyadobacter sp. CY399]|uniref:Uncharacterized protein n=1 Tax=Dyadobacter fanqingshengii TaxID=2906443 RepID=A0A9X1P806_9BACT|nr:hypothetical protein [Dyadobacter fanqingshengii]MCF0039730.1 hypothetical protein [Dyadobacter fanqingshengii]USJ38507.1 hypothetical protein NFI81_12145 [Dyadobacter fanqingshengii]